MSVSSKENQSHDFSVEQAIAEGKRHAAEVEPAVEITLEFTEAERNMIVELTSALTLSVEVLLETAISYVHYKYKRYQAIGKKLEFSRQANNKYEDTHQQTTKPKHRKALTKKLTLAAEISYKLEELGMVEKINECVVTGIDLLYKQLTNGK